MSKHFFVPFCFFSLFWCICFVGFAQPNRRLSDGVFGLVAGSVYGSMLGVMVASQKRALGSFLKFVVLGGILFATIGATVDFFIDFRSRIGGRSPAEVFSDVCGGMYLGFHLGVLLAGVVFMIWRARNN